MYHEVPQVRGLLRGKPGQDSSHTKSELHSKLLLKDSPCPSWKMKRTNSDCLFWEDRTPSYMNDVTNNVGQNITDLFESW